MSKEIKISILIDEKLNNEINAIITESNITKDEFFKEAVIEYLEVLKDCKEAEQRSLSNEKRYTADEILEILGSEDKKYTK